MNKIKINSNNLDNSNNLNNLDNSDNSHNLIDSININKIKKYIYNNYKILKKNDYIEIFKIIVKNNEIYTENLNGIFIDLNKINNKSLLLIYNFIKFIVFKNIELQNMENKINKKKKEFYG